MRRVIGSWLSLSTAKARDPPPRIQNMSNPLRASSDTNRWYEAGVFEGGFNVVVVMADFCTDRRKV